jgi:type VII secretion protein EccE
VGAVERAVAAATARAARTLDRHGWPARALDSDGLVAALVEAAGLDGPPQEHWSTWRSGRLVHTCYEVTGWEPPRGMIGAGVRRIAVSFPAGAPPAVLAMVAAEPGALARVAQGVVAAASGTGVRLRRLDGEQAPAVYAAAPTGRFPFATPRPRSQRSASLGSGR